MVNVVVFHHAQGLTGGVLDFAEQLRAAGHQVSAPDLYDGLTFDNLDDGVAHAQQLGDAVGERAAEAVADLPADLVYIGFSLGVMPAQQMAQNRPGGRAAVLVSGCVPPSAFGGDWPDGMPLQIHGKDADPWMVDDGDLDVAVELDRTVESAQLFRYAGSEHLFADRSLSSYDPDAAELLRQRVLALLDSLG